LLKKNPHGAKENGKKAAIGTGLIKFLARCFMDVSGIQTATIASSVGQNDQVGMKVLKKAMDIQEQSAMQLIQAIPELPDNLGQNINVKA